MWLWKEWFQNPINTPCGSILHKGSSASWRLKKSSVTSSPPAPCTACAQLQNSSGVPFSKRPWHWFELSQESFFFLSWTIILTSKGLVVVFFFLAWVFVWLGFWLLSKRMAGGKHVARLLHRVCHLHGIIGIVEVGVNHREYWECEHCAPCARILGWFVKLCLKSNFEVNLKIEMIYWMILPFDEISWVTVQSQ